MLSETGEELKISKRIILSGDNLTTRSQDLIVSLINRLSRLILIESELKNLQRQPPKMLAKESQSY